MVSLKEESQFVKMVQGSKTCLIILLVGLFWIKLCHSQSFDPLALSLIVREFYENRSESFDFIICASEEKEIKTITDEVVKLSAAENPHKVIRIQESQTVIKVNQSAILLFESLRDYHYFYNRAILFNEYPRNFFFLAYIYNSDTIRHENSLITRNPFGLFRYTTFFLNGRQSTRLTTFVTFQEHRCRDWQEVELNHFSKDHRRWNTKQYFLEKFNDFNACTFYVLIVFPAPPFTVVRNDSRSEFTLIGGYALPINNECSRALNYTFGMRFHHFLQRKDQIALSADFELRSTSIEIIKFHNDTFDFSATDRLAFSEDLVLISKSELYSPLEKLFLPFDEATWTWLIITLVIGFIVTILLQFVPGHLQKFVVGSQVKTPTFNIVVISLGGGFSTVPGRNFARFLLISFFLFSLVMRTAYQGKQFEFMQKTMRKKNVQTIDEMALKNYTIYLEKISAHYFKDLEYFRGVTTETLEMHEFRRIGYLQSQLTDGSKKAALINSAGLSELVHQQNGSGFHALKLRVMGRFNSLMFPKNHFIFDAFNRKVVQLTESGLVDKYVRDLRYKTEKEAKSEPIVFTLEHLGIGFQIWMLFLSCSFLCFLLEFAVKACSS